VEWRLLKGVPAEDVRLLLSVARLRRFARGEVVFHREDPADSLHLIVAGRFSVRVMTPLAETVTIAIRGPGENFGEMALVGEGARRAATVAALEPAETYAVYHEDFHRLRRTHPGIDQILIAFLAGEVRMLNERLLEALYLPVERRVLRRLASLTNTYRHDGEEIEVRLTQEELAEFAGTARETVNRILRDEQERGTIELRRGRIVICDLEALRKRAR
jgi:CRP/FNR family cyclic AMP-dependent transcriptional regulator